ncbi:hypothetical protein LWI28_012315 [Acer negundo]|uniref:Uncharacterized protein n=1 Tax=Acer negundo TaxID=4023 RepID=A0AAD5NWL2_ACENE|nr:hypothetical protein LWI28_012315 [Acer negundo]
MLSKKENGVLQSDFDQYNEIVVTENVEINDNPIEEVRLTVPITDDPTIPALTFRTWVLGLASCCLLAFLNKFFGYRTNQLGIGSISAQIIVMPLGKLMAATLPTRVFHVPLTNWKFSLNPGPFNLKEHVLITIFAGCGAGGVYAVHIITIIKVFYKRSLNPVAAMMLAQTTQLLGYGWAGLFRKYLVDSPYMWWPSNLVQVSLFRALHEKEKRPRGGLTRLQFFCTVFISSFAYYIVPGYLFPSLSALSFVCWIWKDSVKAQQLGSGLNGLGLGSFGLDWSTVASFLGSPLSTPLFAILNMLGGFFLIVYVLLPITYWTNTYGSQRFPIISSGTYDYTGKKYDINRILNKATFDLDQTAYDNYSKLHLSGFFAFSYGLSFATLMAALTHVALYDGKDIWNMWKKTRSAVADKFGDIHTRTMKKNYEAVPQWWFHIVLVVSLALALYACEGFDKVLQLPWWGLLLSCAIALIFTLPIGIIAATTNQAPGLNVITELIIGYIYPGKPVANVAFKTYGYISMTQALTFLSDFKLGHYMKVPPKSMFVAQFWMIVDIFLFSPFNNLHDHQLAGTVAASTVYFLTAWWLLESIPNICDIDNLPEGSPWTCPGDDVFYSASIIWGVVGPGKMFTNAGLYPGLNWFFLIGLVAPVPFWLLSRTFPEKKWLRQIHMPIILGATGGMPPTKAVHYLSWGTVGIFFNFFVYRRFKQWWARHTYILSGALDAGIAFTGVLLYFTLQSYDIFGPSWWGLDSTDHCTLAKCPTEPGFEVKGCPVF